MTDWAGRITFRVSSADPDADVPVWVDLSDYLLTRSTPFDFRVGRQNDLDQAEPASVSITLLNNDDRFTYGNTSSPYASWWGPGRLCQIQEVVGGLTLDRFTGYLQVPTEVIMSAGLQQVVQVSAVDALGRLATSEPFISTLSAHILANGRTSLRAYYPFNNPVEGLFGNVISGTTLPTLVTFPLQFSFGSPPAESARAVTTPAGGPSVLADDIPSYTFNPILDTTGINPIVVSLISTVLPGQNNPGMGLTQAAGETITFAWWMSYTARGRVYALLDVQANNGADLLTAKVYANSAATPWQILATGSSTTTATIPDPPQGTPFLCAVRINTSGLVEYWRNADTPVTLTAGGTLPAMPLTWYALNLAYGLTGSIGHFQVYLGTDGYSRAQHLAQMQIGLNGLERQTTGDRIRTLAQYAGLPNASYVNTIDPGQSVMQAATLANKTPLDAMRDAVRTEQGLLYVDGSGRLIFKDRRTLYNI